MSEDEDYKIVTVFRSQQPDQFHIPRPDPSWDYAETYESLIKASEELKSLILYVSGLEKASEESAERLLNDISFLFLDLQKCSTELYRRFLKDKIVEVIPSVASEELGLSSEEDIRNSDKKPTSEGFIKMLFLKKITEMQNQLNELKTKVEEDSEKLHELYDAHWSDYYER